MIFSHEKLNVYQKSLEFKFINKVLSEGNSGKFTVKDKNHYYNIARGSALESAAFWTCYQ